MNRMAMAIVCAMGIGACATTTHQVETFSARPQIVSVTPDATGGLWVVKATPTYSKDVATTVASGLTEAETTKSATYREIGSERQLWLCVRVTGGSEPQCFEAEWHPAADAVK